MIGLRTLKFTACVIVSALLLTAPAAAQGSISRDEELQVGRVAAAQIMLQLPIVADADWLLYLASLRDALAPFSGRTDVGHQLVIVAHELAHTARRHVAIEIEKARAAALINVLVAVIARSPAAGDLAELLARISQLGHSRALELEADADAMRMMTEAGFNPEKAAGTLRFFNEATGRRQEQTHWAGTHPGFAERVDRLEQTRRQLLDQGLPLRVSYYAREARTGSLVVRLVRFVETRRQWTAQVEVENAGTAGANVSSISARLMLADGRSVDTTFLRSSLGTEVAAGRRISGGVVFERLEGAGAPASLVLPVSIGETHTEVTLSLAGGGPAIPKAEPAKLPRPPAP